MDEDEIHKENSIDPVNPFSDSTEDTNPFSDNNQPNSLFDENENDTHEEENDTPGESLNPKESRRASNDTEDTMSPILASASSTTLFTSAKKQTKSEKMHTLQNVFDDNQKIGIETC
jgi:hypothetical protein